MQRAVVIGGARSGKSAVAEKLAERWAQAGGCSVTYLATAQPSDAEMAVRICRHRDRRPAHWRTAEVPLDVADWLRRHVSPQVVVIDCLSLLLNNWMFLESDDETHIERRVREFVEALDAYPNPVVAVTNEVGHGIVPADVTSRRYRDWLGWLNQAAAAGAQAVYYVVAGIPVDLRRWQAEWHASPD